MDQPRSGLRLEQFIDMLPDPAILLDGATIIAGNAASARLLGVTTGSELTGLSIDELIGSDDGARAAEHIERFDPEHPVDQPLGVQIIRPDRTIVHVDVRLASTPGSPDQLLVLLGDLTERDRLEAEVLASAATSSFLAENSTEVLLRVDEHRCVLYASAATSDVLHHAPADIIGVPLAVLLDPDDRHVLETAFAAASETGRAPAFEARAALAATGAYVWVRVKIKSVHTLDRAGNITSEFHVTIRNVTVERERREALAASERWMRTLVHEAPIGIFELDAAGGCTFANSRHLEILGVRELRDVAGLQWMHMLNPIDQLEVGLRWGQPDPPLEPAQLTVRFNRPDGGEVHTEIGVAPLFTDDGTLSGWLGTLADVTERDRLERSRDEAMQLFSAAFEHAPAGMLVTTAEEPMRLVEANSAQLRMAGLTLEDFGRLRPVDCTHPDDYGAARAGRAALLAGEITTHHMEIRRRFRPSDPWRWYSLVRSVVRDEFGDPVYVIAQSVDVNERVEAEKATYRLAVTDELTGLSNRRHFDDRLTHAHARLLRSDLRIGVVFVDLDHFKIVNDVLGHQEGDRLLEEVANILSGNIRPGDTVARLGGDEFAVIAEHRRPEDLEELADRLRTAIDVRRRLPNGQLHRVTASVGTASRRAIDTAPNELVQLADESMYAAKRSGREPTRTLRE